MPTSSADPRMIQVNGIRRKRSTARILPEYAGIAESLEGSVVETVGRDARGTVFPVEFALGRDITHALGERIIILRDITQRKSADKFQRCHRNPPNCMLYPVFVRCVVTQ